ncbi:MAG: sulfite exporter TauE/SafE family protein, partial [Comamonas sp.]
MLFSLVWTALIMGLVGGPHCLVMCAAPCSVVTAAKPVGGGQPVAVHGLQKRQWLR